MAGGTTSNVASKRASATAVAAFGVARAVISLRKIRFKGFPYDDVPAQFLACTRTFETLDEPRKGANGRERERGAGLRLWNLRHPPSTSASLRVSRFVRDRRAPFSPGERCNSIVPDFWSQLPRTELRVSSPASPSPVLPLTHPPFRSSFAATHFRRLKAVCSLPLPRSLPRPYHPIYLFLA